MKRYVKKQIQLAAVALSAVLVPQANADDLFDASFLGEPVPVAPNNAAETAGEAKPAENAAPALPVEEKKEAVANASAALPLPDLGPAAQNNTETPAPAPEAPTAPDLSLPAPAEMPADTSVPAPSLDVPAPAPSAETTPAPALDPFAMDVPQPPAPSNSGTMDVPPPPSVDASAANTGMSLTAPPSEQFLGKLSSDVFREMAEMERENNKLMLQLKREQLRSEIDALKTANRQQLFDEIERREKMTQARLEWELAQELKRQEALERRQKAEIRQKQIEAALKREEDRRKEKAKKEEEERRKKEEEIKSKEEKEQKELKMKYDAAALIQLNELKPTLMAVTRPPKVKRSPSSRADINLTAIGEDLLTKKKAGQALTGISFGGAEVPKGSAQDDSNVKRSEPASMLYSVAEIRGTAGTLIAKLVSKKDKMTFYAKKNTILPTGHTVIDIDKDFVLVQLGKTKEMIGFPSAGLLSEAPAQETETPAPEGTSTGAENQPPPPRRSSAFNPRTTTTAAKGAPSSGRGRAALSGAALAR